MADGFEFFGAGAGFEDSGVFLPGDAFVESLLGPTLDGEGCGGFADVLQSAEGGEGEVFFEQAFERHDGSGGLLATEPLLPPRAERAPSEAPSEGSDGELSNSLDDGGFVALHDRHVSPPSPLSIANYAPLPEILAAQPEAPPGLMSIYAPMTTPHLRTSADAKAHRRRARLAPKSQATDIARVKEFGRDYWVRRIYNAMVDIRYITDGPQSVHRMRFTQELDGQPTFSVLDLEATAHHVFDEAIAVHERGWNRPIAYHKKVVRGKLVDRSEANLEMRLSRICLCLLQKKSSVDDAIRGGVTLALLCDNPEARSFTKASNDVGNKKRGERLKATSRKEKTRKGLQAQQPEIEVEEQGVEDVQKEE
ncbi:uncharacterized protein EKO05_0004473 [Ascochyta rabiei]|uniref:Uncharacterized protein n=1 Tax=Didymella rabiei TaxID=5454 RepID=A0A163DMB9_DIDRA|nr:uncharacterized protein EKO05_0004473 [Ascochyta rabiei]KZM23253.1 hypothetical protein ST47_g5575 [Ascochyta rabiei]UPX13980.1 hypothetical protein EKO05_0004473 [Ascochyta rabiei]